jgi:hypothetical protein
VDAFAGGILRKLTNLSDENQNSPMVGDFSPLSQYVVLAFNKRISIWDWSEGKKDI